MKYNHRDLALRLKPYVWDSSTPEQKNGTERYLNAGEDYEAFADLLWAAKDTPGVPEDLLQESFDALFDEDREEFGLPPRQ
ncbi:hypothetical protein I6E29_00840 [Arcanobacterium haemolyticum]|nr:hypothetical protein [Arcanobacterium haemolyticum]